MDSFVVQSRDDGAGFELRRHNQRHLVAELHGRGLDASVLVSAYMFSGFADIVAGHATAGTGWLGGHGLRPAPFRPRASRPQLKRDPLDGATIEVTSFR